MFAVFVTAAVIVFIGIGVYIWLCYKDDTRAFNTKISCAECKYQEVVHPESRYGEKHFCTLNRDKYTNEPISIYKTHGCYKCWRYAKKRKEK